MRIVLFFYQSFDSLGAKSLVFPPSAIRRRKTCVGTETKSRLTIQIEKVCKSSLGPGSYNFLEI